MTVVLFIELCVKLSEMQIQFDFSVVSVMHAKSTEQQSVYQFQRYMVIFVAFVVGLYVM
jgi:hypothetical protein